MKRQKEQLLLAIDATMELRPLGGSCLELEECCAAMNISHNRRNAYVRWYRRTVGARLDRVGFKDIPVPAWKHMTKEEKHATRLSRLRAFRDVVEAASLFRIWWEAGGDGVVVSIVGIIFMVALASSIAVGLAIL